MKPGDGEVDPGEPPDRLGFDLSHLRTHPEDAEDPEEVRPHPPPPQKLGLSLHRDSSSCEFDPQVYHLLA